MKSEKLKTLENELRDLKKWLDLDLVPKKDIERHKSEIKIIEEKIEEEKRRLTFLKENGDMEDYTLAKKAGQQKQLYEHESMADVSSQEETTEESFEVDSRSFEAERTTLFDIEMGDREKSTQEYDSEDDPYSDKNRWRRSMEIVDPEQDDW